MVWSSFCKLLQKQTYDVLSHRYGTFILLGGIILVIVSGFQFGEVALEWSQEKYAAVFNSFSDNVAGKSFQNRLCLPVPIDVVYTWVNGSDPQLLQQLRHFKAMMEMALNETRELASIISMIIGCFHSLNFYSLLYRTLISNRSHVECPFRHCVPSAAVVIDPVMPPELSLAAVALLYPSFKHVIRQIDMKTSGQETNVTVLYFDTHQHAEAALKEHVLIRGQNATIKTAFYTSDWTLANSVLLQDAVVITGFPHTLSADQLLQYFPEKVPRDKLKLTMHTEQGVAVLEVSDHGLVETILKETNISIDGKHPTLSAGCLIWDMHDVRYNEEISASRFADNEELRYSLRSVETYAPWVRHIYLVTNGQIPSWLNLDNPRLTIVTHQEIFQNLSHLPTFSSPAIESHLHHIPGLSAKFIYMNDDVMFGKEVWPEDFYTHGHGQKVYLTWPIPNCQDGCPSSWIRDGYCDKACNNSECEWDGGDCAGGAPDTFQGGAGGIQDWQAHADTMYCSQGCANNWVADRYCDQTCNVKECGFDAGDCGVASFDKLLCIDLDPSKIEYTIPKGEAVAYFNLSALFDDGTSLEEGHYGENAAIRSATLAQKFKTLSLLLFEKENSTVLHFQIKAKNNNHSAVEFRFNVSVDPTPLKMKTKGRDKSEKEQKTQPADDKKMENSTGSKEEEKIIFLDVPVDLQQPQALVEKMDRANVNMSLFELSTDAAAEWRQLLQEYNQGDLTEKGFQQMQAVIWKAVLEQNSNVPPPLKVAPLNKDIHKYNEAPPGVQESNRLLSATGPMKKDHVVQVPTSDQKGGQKKPDSTFDVYLQSKQQHQSLKDGHKADGWERLTNNDMARQKDHLQDAGQMHQFKQGKAADERAKAADERAKAADTKANHIRQVDIHAQELNGKARKFGNGSYKSRKLTMALGPLLNQDNTGFLPWEKQHVFGSLQKRKEALQRSESYEVASIPKRHLLDTYGESLRHVNRIYNEAYGYSGRKVPAHMPHLVDKYVMYDMQLRFPKQWDESSSHRIRSSTDMQFAFAYMYFLMSEPQPTTVGDIFDELDNDHSRVLSDREIRTMATRLFDLPLDLQTLTGLEQMLINCSRHLPSIVTFTWGGRSEVYYDKDMPQVTKILLNNCPPVIDLIQKGFKGRTKYKFEVVDDTDIAFKMIRTNVSQVVGQLDDIRKNPKKFICLNDNIDHTKEEAKTVKAVLLDFYESILPVASSFELPREYRNRFLHTRELREWRKYRDWLKLWTQLALGLLIVFTVGSFFIDKIKAVKRHFFRPRVVCKMGEDSPRGRQSACEAAGQAVPAATPGTAAGPLPDLLDV